MSASLVGSEMCIRDSLWPQPLLGAWKAAVRVALIPESAALQRALAKQGACLLYTSDAADDM
eukprot:12914904-Alexandrium_andersonii.AAC.1